MPSSFFEIRSKDLVTINYLDEGVFLNCEEDILSTNIYRIEGKIGFVSSVIYEHRHTKYSTTTRESKVVAECLVRKSKRYYQYKYLSLNMFERILLRIAERINYIESILKRKMFEKF